MKSKVKIVGLLGNRNIFFRIFLQLRRLSYMLNIRFYILYFWSLIRADLFS